MKRTLKRAMASLTAAAIACTSLAVTSFATITNTEDGTYCYNLALPSDYALSDVYGARFTIDIADLSAGVGGGFIINSGSTGWKEISWGNDGSDKELILSNDDYSVSYLSTEPVFTSDDEWAQFLVKQYWGNDFAVTSMEALDKDGNVICYDESLVEDVETPVEPEEPVDDDSYTVSLEDELCIDSADTQIANVSVKDVEVMDGYYLSKIDFTCQSDWATAGWIGGGGNVGFNFNKDGNWFSGDYAPTNDAENEWYATVEVPYTMEVVVDEETGETDTIEQNFAESIASSGMIQFGWYWGADASIDISNIVLTFSKIPEEAVLEEELLGTSASIEDGVIGLNFFMSFGDDVLADENAILSVTYADGTVEALAISDGVETENGYKYPVYVDAKEMADDVTIQVAMSDGTVGKEYTYSVMEYANTIIANEEGTYSDTAVKLANAMLVYGGYAQEYFGYNTENLASEGLDTTLGNPRLNNTTKYTEGELPEGVEYIGSSLVLNGATQIRHYFTATDASVLPEGYTQKGDFYYYSIQSIFADGLDDAFTLTIGDWFIEYAAIDYAYAIVKNSDSYSAELVNLVTALRLFNIAANNFVA